MAVLVGLLRLPAPSTRDRYPLRLEHWLGRMVLQLLQLVRKLQIGRQGDHGSQ